MYVVDYGFLKGTVIDRKTGYGNVVSVSCFVPARVDTSKLMMGCRAGGGGGRGKRDPLTERGLVKEE